ncbi:UNVERIFIED_CONTAM: 4'-phosphopantetheinyl transferase, partial [Bacteroidetes bacterium 56_B9]
RPTPVPFITGRWVIRDGYVIVSTSVPALEFSR